MSLYNPDHPYSNGLEGLLDGHTRDWPILFALVAERLQRIELDLAAVQLDLSTAQQEIAELKASGAENTHRTPSPIKSDRL